MYKRQALNNALSIDVNTQKDIAVISYKESEKQNLETNFSKLSDDEKNIISRHSSGEVKQRIENALVKQFKDNPLDAVFHCFITYSIPKPFGTGKDAVFTLSCRQFLSNDSQHEYDTLTLSLNRLFAYMGGKTEEQKKLAVKDIKFFLGKAFALFTNNPIYCNGKDMDLLIQSSVNVRGGRATTYKEHQVQSKIEFVLHSKLRKSDYFIELLSKNKDFNRIVPEAVEFVADKKEQPKAEISK